MLISKRAFLFASASYFATARVGAFASGFDDMSYPHLVQGPMLGAVTPTEALIWTRANGEYEVEIRVDTDPLFKHPFVASRQLAKSENDFVTVHSINGLKENTNYYYRVFLNRGKALGQWARQLPDLSFLPPFNLKTAPALGSKTKFRLAFGSCARLQGDPIQPIWNAVSLWKPDLFFWLGDNIYSDSKNPEIIAGQYRQQRAVSSMQKVSRTVPQLAIWDDHDYGRNDYDRANPIREESLDVFKRYWANPHYGLTNTPGVFFSYTYGGVDFFFLDGRYYRDSGEQPNNNNKTMLGSEQKEWLKKELLKSTAPFKFLICGTGWSNVGGQDLDSWSSFLNERNEILDFIRDEGIGGVVLLSGDTHYGELNAIPWSEKGGYDFYNFVSSPLAQATSNKFLGRNPEVRIRTPYSGTTNFGVIDFDMTTDEPVLTFNLIGVHGGAVWEPLILKASELTNGVMTWENKIK